MVLRAYSCRLSLLILLLFSLLSPLPTAKAGRAEEILADIYKRQAFEKVSYILDLQVDLEEAGKVQTALVRVYVHESNKQLVSFLSPARMAGQSFLVIGNNTWMHQEGLNRPLRISAQQKLFGEAGIAETVGIDYLNDYRLLSMEKTESKYIIDLEAIDRGTAYQKVRLWICRGEWRIEKSFLMASNGLIFKELHFSNYQLLKGHELAEISIINHLYDKGQKTLVRYLDIEESPLAEALFDPLAMANLHFLLKAGENRHESP